MNLERTTQTDAVVKNPPYHIGSGYAGDECWEESAIDRE